MTRTACPPLTVGLLLLLGSTAFATAAQQAPVTGQMLGGPLPPAAPVTLRTPGPAEVYALDATPAPAEPAAAPDHHTPAPAPAYAPAAVAPVAAPAYAASTPQRPVRAKPGDTTRQLLQLQASGTQAGRALPILGDQATASYQRYLKSFEHELPVFFENNVGKSIQGGGGN